MATIQVILDKPLRQLADKEAKRMKTNRSAVIRHMMQEYFKRKEILAMEEREREGYRRIPDRGIDPDWEAEAVWPED
jgi:metal-responsive CopG/Arc/MetJ family transcriptional regulator